MNLSGESVTEMKVNPSQGSRRANAPLLCQCCMWHKQKSQAASSFQSECFWETLQTASLLIRAKCAAFYTEVQQGGSDTDWNSIKAGFSPEKTGLLQLGCEEGQETKHFYLPAGLELAEDGRCYTSSDFPGTEYGLLGLKWGCSSAQL